MMAERRIWMFPAINGGTAFEVHEYPAACPPSGYLVTVWPDGKECGAKRDGIMSNLDYARHLGYDNVRDALREHELAHHHVARWLGDPWSPTLRTVALGYKGEEAEPYERRMAEEAMVLAFQRFMRTENYDAWLLQRIGGKVHKCDATFRRRYVTGQPDRIEQYDEPEQAA